jgi:hypothetical protein
MKEPAKRKSRAYWLDKKTINTEKNKDIISFVSVFKLER